MRVAYVDDKWQCTKHDADKEFDFLEEGVPDRVIYNDLCVITPYAKVGVHQIPWPRCPRSRAPPRLAGWEDLSPPSWPLNGFLAAVVSAGSALDRGVGNQDLASFKNGQMNGPHPAHIPVFLSTYNAFFIRQASRCLPQHLLFLSHYVTNVSASWLIALRAGPCTYHHCLVYLHVRSRGRVLGRRRTAHPPRAGLRGDAPSEKWSAAGGRTFPPALFCGR